jgi:hypothetical protein
MNIAFHTLVFRTVNNRSRIALIENMRYLIREDYMKILSYRIGKQIAVCLVLSLALTMSEVAEAAPSPMLNPQESQSAPAQDQSQQAGTQTQSAQATAPQAPAPQTTATQAGPDQSGQSPSSLAKPVGTAAAPSEPVTGVAATRPVGAAIAPAKQRRARTLLIRMSIVIGAAVAVGTVVALSKASPARPN